MKNIYVKLENSDGESTWIKLIMNYANELNLDNIVMSINQMLINKRPINVFFEYPNILFNKITPISYSNLSDRSHVKEITTKDQDSSHDIIFTSYSSLKETLYGMIGDDTKNES